jgi:hypothetical protein
MLKQSVFIRGKQFMKPSDVQDYFPHKPKKKQVKGF